MAVRKSALVALCLLATPAYADPISGYVHKDGTVAVQSSLYTVQRTARGHYVIAFTNQMSPSASCVFTPVGVNDGIAFPHWVDKITESDTQCEVVFDHYAKGGVKADNAEFSFIATPMSN